MIDGGLTGWPQRHHVPPAKGDDQPKAPGTQPRRRSQAGGGGGLVTVNNRLFAPLQGIDPKSPLQGGYGWLDYTDAGMTRHPGLDLNTPGGCASDAGKAVVAPLAGVVQAAIVWDQYTPGEGNHVWLELTDSCLPGPTWFHVDHLQAIHCVVGQQLSPGETFGLCGKSGGWDCEHAHSEWLKGPPRDGWWQWPYGWSQAQVEAAYWSPSDWWNAATAKVLAEGNQPIPPEVVEVLSDWEVLNWIAPDLWAWAGIDYNPEGLTSKAWLAELRAGRYRGRPRTADRPYGDGRGDWAEFDLGVVVTNSATGEWSWQG